MAKLKVGKGVSLSQAEMRRGAKAYNDWHWGIGAQQVIDRQDPDYPDMLIECGRLVRMHVRVPQDAKSNRHPRRQRDTMIELSKQASSDSHVAYDPDHPDERLHLLLNPTAQKTIARRFFHENMAPEMSLNHLASIAGGRHSKRLDYPNVHVKPIGVLTAVVYYTHKKGDENANDDRSYYIHQMGELSHYFPVLAADQKGRLWLAGGNYTCPTPGITD